MEKKNKLTSKARKLLKKGPQGLKARTKIALEEGLAERQIQNWVRDSDPRLFKDTNVAIMETELGIPKSEIIAH